jgi:glycosyltransferase involved in cell wall biosynthesis
MVLAHPEDEFLFLFDRPFDPRFIYAENVKPLVLFPPARHPVLFYLWFEWAVPHALRQFGADLFFSPDSMCSLRSSIPTVMTTHDIVPLHFPEQLPFVTRHYLLNRLPLFLKRAELVLTVSDYVKQDILQQCSIENDKIEVVYNGCREGFVPLSEGDQQLVRDQFTGGQPYFFYTGAIHPRKNIHRLIQAFDQFKQKTGAGVQLLLAGRFAWKTGVVKDAWEQSPYQQDIQFLGYVPEEDLTRLMASALAMTYISLSEGFGLPMVEAMHAGTPVLAADATCLPEIAGDAALFVDPVSVESIAAGMLNIHAEPELRQELRAKGLERAKLFNWDAAAEKIYWAFRRLIKSETNA